MDLHTVRRLGLVARLLGADRDRARRVLLEQRDDQW
jgi:hypothetical protein